MGSEVSVCVCGGIWGGEALGRGGSRRGGSGEGRLWGGEALGGEVLGRLLEF